MSQRYGSRILKFWAVLRIRDGYSGSRIRIYPSRIQGQKYSGSRIRIKELSFFNPENCYLSYRKYDLVCSSRIRILIFTHPGSRGQKGTGSRIRIRNTGSGYIVLASWRASQIKSNMKYDIQYSGRTKYSAFVSKLNKLSEEYLSPQKTQKAAVFFIGKILGSRLI
jgi:hypothetical protein